MLCLCDKKGAGESGWKRERERGGKGEREQQEVGEAGRKRGPQKQSHQARVLEPERLGPGPGVASSCEC